MNWKTGREAEGDFHNPISDLLHYLNMHKFMGTDELHSKILKKLVDVLTKPLYIIFQQSWNPGEVSVEWRVANVTPIFKNGQREDLGNCMPVRSQDHRILGG